MQRLLKQPRRKLYACEYTACSIHVLGESGAAPVSKLVCCRWAGQLVEPLRTRFRPPCYTVLLQLKASQLRDVHFTTAEENAT